MPLLPGIVARSAAVFAAILIAFGIWAAIDWQVSAPPDALAKARYVGRDACITCHQAEAADWAGSDHDRAMEVAAENTVLGDFNDAVFVRLGETTRFFRDGEKFMVNAEGPDGQYRDYEIAYTFGVRPLQQYMVKFPGGRMQVLRVSWDVDKKEWFYVAPPDAEDERILPGDPLHWTGLAQNWNTMCAECHSTDYHKNFDVAKNEYHSNYFEIDVSCEACHGPGSLHVELAESKSLFWDRRVGYGLTNTLKNAGNAAEIETCAPCHSRRAIIHADYRPGDSFFDAFDPVLLTHGLYYSDGQIQDEVYEYGSFTQSKMYRKGVRCADCHNPHSLKLKFEGNRLCAQCHQPGRYDSPAHHHHANAAPGAEETQCVTCHMPTRVYMGIDERRDHSLRIPRPDMTVSIGTPNVCNRCHTKPEEDAQWAADKVVEWYGEKRPDDPHYGFAFHAAQQGRPEGGALLAEVLDQRDVADVVRATAVELLAGYPGAELDQVRRRALSDPSPLVRAAAIRAATPPSAARLVELVGPKLEDGARSVRMAAASRLVSQAEELSRRPHFRSALEDAIAEFRAGQSLHLDRADAHMSLAQLNASLGDLASAAESLRGAIRAEPYRTGPRGLLAQLLAQLAADPEQRQAAEALDATPDEITDLRTAEADLLKRDAELLAGDPGPHYRRGMLLYLLDRPEEAREELAEACRLGPNDYQNWLALALICEKLERWEEAAQALKRMSELQPDSEDWKGILVRMRNTMQEKQNADAAANAPRSEGQSAAESRGQPPPDIDRPTGEETSDDR